MMCVSGMWSVYALWNYGLCLLGLYGLPACGGTELWWSRPFLTVSVSLRRYYEIDHYHQYTSWCVPNTRTRTQKCAGPGVLL